MGCSVHNWWCNILYKTGWLWHVVQDWLTVTCCTRLVDCDMLYKTGWLWHVVQDWLTVTSCTRLVDCDMLYKACWLLTSCTRLVDCDILYQTSWLWHPYKTSWLWHPVQGHISFSYTVASLRLCFVQTVQMAATRRNHYDIRLLLQGRRVVRQVHQLREAAGIFLTVCWS